MIIPRIHSSDPMPDALRGGIAALGNFDGFHLGHQAVAGEAIRQARSRGVPAIIATFDPHPVRFFIAHSPPFKLTTLDQRQQLFAEAGADAMLVFDFDASMAATSAEDFVTTLLGQHLGLSGVVTGEDFTFGKARSGNIETLRNVGAGCGITTTAMGPVADAGGVISSSRIRDALREGDCVVATRLLSRPFTVEGIVQHGDKNGRLLGFPTANIGMGNYLRPRYGIYAVRGYLPDGRVLGGVANLGIRPSFDPPKELFEPHFFDFDGDLYGQTIAVEFLAFIRGEEKFDDMEALKAQIAEDCEAARALLG